MSNLLAALKRRLSYGEEVGNLLADDLTRLAGPGRRLRILDVGCGTTSLLANFNASPARAACHLIGLDAHEPTVTWCRASGFHDEYLLCDAREHERIPEVDVIVATDLVEHFEKPVATQLIQQFERKASTAVLLFTPNGFIFNPFPPDNPYMEHKCGFTVDEFEARGYECTGLGGPKFMRGAQSLPRGPKILTLPALMVLSRAMRGLPRQSFHIFARKSMAHEAAGRTADPAAGPASGRL